MQRLKESERGLETRQTQTRDYGRDGENAGDGGEPGEQWLSARPMAEEAAGVLQSCRRQDPLTAAADVLQPCSRKPYAILVHPKPE